MRAALAIVLGVFIREIQQCSDFRRVEVLYPKQVLCTKCHGTSGLTNAAYMEAWGPAQDQRVNSASGRVRIGYGIGI